MRLRSLVRREDDSDFDQELASHLQLHIDDNLRSGMSAAEARRAALLKFGGVESAREAHRQRRGLPFVSHAGKDLRHGLRMLRRDPFFTATAAVTLALGVGANAAMFGLVDALMFRPPAHVHEPERVFGLSGVRNYLQYLDLQDRTRTLEVAAYTRTTLSLGLGADAHEIQTECVTLSFFPALGTRPHTGRLFGAVDDETQDLTVVLGHHLWRTRFGADPSVVGRTVRVASRSYQVIGVAPPGFRGIELEPVDAWLLLPVSPEACSFTGTNLLWNEGGSWLSALARLRGDATPDQAAAELATFTKVDAVTASGREIRREFTLEPLDRGRLGGRAGDRRLAPWLAGGAVTVLLIACANVMGLLAVRAIDRRREIAVRRQVGSSRGRIFGQLLTENLVLAAFCGSVALGLAAGLDQALRRFFPFIADDGVLSGRALGLLVTFAIGAAIASGLVPAWQAARTKVTDTWRSGPGPSDERLRGRRLLLVGQVALALALVMAAGLFVRSLGELRSGLGFDLDRVIAVSIDMQKAGRRSPAEIRDLFDRLAERMASRSDVTAVALSSGGLLGSGGSMIATFLSSGPDARPLEDSIIAQQVTPGYFETMGTRIIAGRSFEVRDAQDPRPVVVLDERLADDLWPGEPAVGRCAYSGSTCLTVVGVSEARRTSLTRHSREFFQPMSGADSHAQPQVLYVRTRDAATEASPSIAAELRASAADLPYIRVQPLEILADDRTRSWRLGATMFGLFGVLALILTAVGIYSTLAFSTRRQVSEIGVRMTLGATPGNVLAMVGRRGLTVVVIGWVLGAAATYFMTGLIESQLYGVAPTDARAFAGASAAVVLAGVAGTIIPALRASRIDPAVALRTE